MAHGQLVASSYCYTHGASRYLVWLQGSGRDLRAIYGYRSYVWSYGWYHR